MPDPDQRTNNRMQVAAQRRVQKFGMQDALVKAKPVPTDVIKPPATLIPTQVRDNPLLNAPKRLPQDSKGEYQKFLRDWLQTAKNVPYSKA